ncbi:MULTISPECIES: YceI family protein [unclassified Brevundimonas]|uniref:YceI family protein n=1 Tax=unclassified Brevundimonas TaxID=2622653 RepID=UPI0025BB2724|nr:MULTISPECIES: YceI family protein [unclassified Brevundimonas]
MSTRALARKDRYSAVAIALHWLIGLSILAMIPMGWWMGDAIEQPETQALAYRVFQIHKSVGFLILALTFVRIVWRLTHPVPALPAQMHGWERFAARATHVAFYALMLALPLTGWAYVSSGWAVVTDTPLPVPTLWFGLFTIPHIGFIEHASEAVRRTVGYMAMGAHSKLAWGAIVLVALHVGAALKHQFLNRDGVLAHMVPVLPHADVPLASPPSAKEKWLERFAGVAFVAVIGVAFAIAAKPAPKAEMTAAETTPVAVAETSVMAGTAPAWTVDASASSISFSGTHSGAPFTGSFQKWEADIRFDPADLAGSTAVVTVDTASAQTGDATKDGSLKGAEWFNPAQFPTARFEATEFVALDGNRYEARGTLRIKSASQPVVLPFTFDEASGEATVTGKVAVDRTRLDLGMVSDAAASWVSKMIEVEINVRAKKAA